LGDGARFEWTAIPEVVSAYESAWPGGNTNGTRKMRNGNKAVLLAGKCEPSRSIYRTVGPRAKVCCGGYVRVHMGHTVYLYNRPSTHLGLAVDN